MMRRWLLALVFTCLAFRSAVAEEAWPEFRGPHGTGLSQGTGLPVKWSETSPEVRWKTPIHDKGWSSPVIWGNQIWLTTARPDGSELYAVCIDRDSGKTLHDVKVFDVENIKYVNPINSYASPTPVLEAGRLFVHFGTY